MEEGNNGGLGKLLPKSISAKRRRRRHKDTLEPDAADHEQSRGRGRRLSWSKRPATASASTSTSPLGSDDANSISPADDDDRSFGSYESNVGETPPARPATISTHPSLIGYLTTSSPEVRARVSDSEDRLRPQTSPSGAERSAAASRGTSPSPSSHKSEQRPLTPPFVEPPAAAKVAPPDRRSRGIPRIHTTSPPRTPAVVDKNAPAIVSTPPTPTDSARSSTATSPEGRRSFQISNSSTGADGSPAWRGHRRSKSGSVNIGPSKLSNIVTAPLTPTAESGEASSGPSTPSGFFSSMLSAAQNAATNFSSNVQNTGAGGNKKSTSTPRQPPSPEPSSVEVEPSAEARIDDNMEQKEAAVRTLGAGDLSLSHLGLAEPAPGGSSPASARFPDVVDTRARSESAPVEAQSSNADLVSEGPSSRPRSLNEGVSGDQTPPQAADLVDGSKGGLHRTSSVRSAMKQRRKRGSSVTTGGTGTAIGAAVAAASSVAGPTAAAGFGAPKLTGFAIASKKRNRDFHTFFKSVPDDDYLIEDYSCALQREILAHGRLYVSEGHLCFSSNILGWTTTLVMSFDEIVSVEKRSTALVFKNGLMISTLHAKHTFASFTSRDATYDLIVNIWKLGHPTVESTQNGVRLEGTGGDKTEKVDGEGALEVETQAGSESEEESDDDEEEFYYEEDSQEPPETQPVDVNGSEAVNGEAEKVALRKASGMTPSPIPADVVKESSPAPGAAADFPGPATHAPTECGDAASHYDKVVGDDVIAAPLGKVYNLMFGPPAWMSKWLVVDQKCTELQMEDKKGLSLDNKSRSFNYIKPLYASIGPRQTKCIVSETVDSLDFEKSASLSSSTQTPDVPSGNVFAVKTKYCLSWADNNAARVLVTCTIEWTGKSWLKGPIEKGAIDGQAQHFKDLFTSLKAEVSAKPRTPAAVNGAPKALKKKGKKSKTLQAGADADEGGVGSKHAAKQEWGMLEPLRGLLGPLADIVQPILTGNVMYGLLVGLLVASWFGFGFGPGRNAAPYGPGPGMYSPERLAAYEEMWRREDSELWDWLEERVGLGRLGADAPAPRKRAMEPRTMEERLREERMDEREVDEAIRVTEEKLRVLRGVVGRAAPEPAGEAGEEAR